MRSAGVGEQGMFAKGLPGNLGDPAVSTSVSRRQRIEAPACSTDEEPVNSNSPLPRDEQKSVVPPERTKESGTGRTMGSRSALTVPRKPENRIPRDPVEGSEASGHGTAEGKRARDIELAMHVNDTWQITLGSAACSLR